MFLLPHSCRKMKGHMVLFNLSILFALFPLASAFLSQYGSKPNFRWCDSAERILVSRGSSFIAFRNGGLSSKHHRGLARCQIMIRVHQKEETSEEKMASMPLPSVVAINSGVSDPAKQSKSALEFFAMMDEFSSFTKREIGSVQSPRLRALFEGVQAGGRDPYVLRAFEILYEDLAPLRVAGRMIYRNLKDVIIKSSERRNQEEMKLQAVAGFTLDQIEDGRKAFMKLSDGTGGELSLDQLVDAGVVETIVELLGFATFDDLMATLDQDRNGKLNFEEFMIGIQRCADDNTGESVCTVGEVLDELQKRMEKFELQQNTSSLEKRKLKYIARYDEMVRLFKEWEDIVPTGESRMVEILRGCFAGAKNQKVVDALRIVYVDYSALRLSGDLIFGLMERIVKASTRKKL